MRPWWLVPAIAGLACGLTLAAMASVAGDALGRRIVRADLSVAPSSTETVSEGAVASSPAAPSGPTWTTTATTALVATSTPTITATTSTTVAVLTQLVPVPHDAGVLACIRHWEQGRDGYATDTGNGYYGAYQFTLSTWLSVGGQGNPAAAEPAEQDARAWALYERDGLSPWPTPARECR